MDLHEYCNTSLYLWWDRLFIERTEMTLLSSLVISTVTSGHSSTGIIWPSLYLNKWWRWYDKDFDDNKTFLTILYYQKEKKLINWGLDFTQIDRQTLILCCIGKYSIENTLKSGKRCSWRNKCGCFSTTASLVHNCVRLIFRLLCSKLVHLFVEKQFLL